MKRFLVFNISLFCVLSHSYAQSYPPITPPLVKSHSSIFVDREDRQDSKSDLLKKVNTLEANVNNFVPMLMKNSSDINKIRDNADSLVADLKKQLQDLKHSVRVYDLRLLDIIDRLDKLEKDKVVSIDYVKTPLDVELNKANDKTNTSFQKSNNNVNSSTPSVKSENSADKNSPDQLPLHKPSNQNSLSIQNLQDQSTYQDPLAKNQIHIPNL